MGRLELYLGFASGVGKTYRMLQEAHTLADGGADLVVAFVESHGRAETAALVAGLEQVPRTRETCFSSYPPHAATLLQRGSHLAGRSSSEWSGFDVHIVSFVDEERAS